MTDCLARKSLHEIELPKNVRLEAPVLRQRVLRGLVVRTFTLIYEGDKRLGPVEHEEVYEYAIADAAQIGYALRRLMRKVELLQTERTANAPKRIDVAKATFGAAIARLESQLGVVA